MKGAFARNASWMMAGQCVGFVLQAAGFMLLARLLESREYGIYVGAVAMVSLVSQFSPLGSGLLFLRYVSPDHSKCAPYLGNIVMATCTCGGLLTVLLWAIAGRIVNPASASIIVLVALNDCICSKLVDSAGQVFQAFERLQTTAMMNLSIGFVRLATVAAIYFTVRRANVWQWAEASLLASIVAAVIAIGAVLSLIGLPSFDLRLFAKRALEGFGFSFAGSTTSLYNDLDKTMLSHYGLNLANGVYTMAYRVVDIATTPIRAVHSAALPGFFRQGAKDGVHATLACARTIIKKTALWGAFAAVSMFILSPLIPLAAGQSFAQSAEALRYLCLIPLFRSLHLGAGDALTGAGLQPARTTAQFVAVGINLALNLLLISSLGWRGAAIASLATDGALAAMNWGILLLRAHSTVAVPATFAIQGQGEGI